MRKKTKDLLAELNFVIGGWRMRGTFTIANENTGKEFFQEGAEFEQVPTNIPLL